MKIIKIAGIAVILLFLLLGAWWIGVYYAFKKLDAPVREAADLRQLSFFIINYTDHTNEFPISLRDALKETHYEWRYFDSFVTNPNFVYLKPDTLPSDTVPTTTIMEFKVEEGIYRAHFGGSVVFLESPSSALGNP